MKFRCLLILLTISAVFLTAQTESKPAAQKAPKFVIGPPPSRPSNDAVPPMGGMQQVAILEQRYRQAALDGDAAYVKKLLATTYVGTGPDGAVSNRMQTITAYETGAIKFTDIELDDMQGMAYGTNVVVINARAVVKGKFDDRDISGNYRYTRVWIKQGSKWLAIAFQASPEMATAKSPEPTQPK